MYIHNILCTQEFVACFLLCDAIIYTHAGLNISIKTSSLPPSFLPHCSPSVPPPPPPLSSLVCNECRRSLICSYSPFSSYPTYVYRPNTIICETEPSDIPTHTSHYPCVIGYYLAGVHTRGLFYLFATILILLYSATFPTASKFRLAQYQYCYAFYIQHLHTTLLTLGVHARGLL